MQKDARDIIARECIAKYSPSLSKNTIILRLRPKM